MCLVRGDKENLSIIPKGIKIISELLNTEWKQRLDEFWSADMYNSVRGLAATVQCVLLSQFMLSEHINTLAVPHGVAGKTLHLASGSVVTNTIMHGSGKHWQGATHLHTVCRHTFDTHYIQWLPPALWWYTDRSRLTDTHTHTLSGTCDLRSELGPELGHF